MDALCWERTQLKVSGWLPTSDITSWDFSAKDNLHGIGYRGMSREHLVTSQYNKGVYGMSGQVRRGGGTNNLYIYMYVYVHVQYMYVWVSM